MTRNRWILVAALVVAGVVAAPLLGLAFLYVVDPMGDEWVCSHGEAPAGSACYPVDATLPTGVTWDPLGNRPMAYNCDKRGWTLIRHGSGDEEDCLNDNLHVPAGWHRVD
ncbi:hypothetical protein [Nocardioides sp. URHA0020]|uniref:hypothetical protein n=1 Tax=Nocardioides sp. URHA0020 TaxID=1380392 RepID=UPI00048F778E|nr:hypothetical protein [Nocardioides sp. URHA0020]